MVNLTLAIAATITFILATFLILILQNIVPPLVDTATTDLNEGQAGMGDELAGILEVAYILICGLGTLVVPAALFYMGITEPQEKPNPILHTTIALLYGFFSLALTYFIFSTNKLDIPNKISLQITEPLMQAFFWTGLILVWLTNTLIIPVYMILDARKTSN